MNIFKTVGILLLLVSSSCFSGELVKNSTIIDIGSSSDGLTDNFYIRTSGGVGPCAGSSIVFKRTAAMSAEFFNRLYSTALMAYTTNAKKVRIYNPADDSCRAATYIQVTK
jgi:hypothetical protein